ncbi:hypothetical protein ACIHFD_32690 [Nonomuraea sp. NPDC051941]|uniref:hypothetical protein n=1 Tax=Nonomuraea sp. NPDC051941 TaxID=3364373 RepID=UPI0037CA19FD
MSSRLTELLQVQWVSHAVPGEVVQPVTSGETERADPRSAALLATKLEGRPM